VPDWTPATLEIAPWSDLADRLTSLPEIPAPHIFEAPISRPGKIVCIGLNYTDHAEEASMPVPAEPVFFLKASTAWCGPNEDVPIPPGAQKMDWEIELAIVVGRRARHVTPSEALDVVLGYTILNDVSERGYQLERGGQWTKGKSYDGFAPAGPFIAIRGEIPDVQRLSMTLDVNGTVRQQGNTAHMIFDVAFLVSYVSQFMTLEPGDVISTGTPAGVGLGHKPSLFLQAGDVMNLTIEGLGQQRQRLVQGIDIESA
jgi:ureidoglycolate lyase/2,4-diketo-3-deoxy-L-fuconate hydrolase